MSLAQIAAKKIYKETVIPTGRYKVIIVYSNRFNRMLRRLVGVLGFGRILIHPGNFIRNIEGCLLPGLTNWIQDKEYCVESSVTAHDRLASKILAAEKKGEEIWITIKTDYKSATV
ncbi:DUF5675 family protein [Dyadobacter chenwenxiniae]|uniref:DUF5675 family protein n=1 Tax=Dyadobacter chenwenxiniae TaxID=2906456 RepID=A0A9X1TLV3_9BACT|nr:DUF5675 family protein [Dyadobacter chenwenxiniae]MCF0062788.1 DUF5675 family protein [Dyadobacter chenwenxiniae]UON85037.1 DUF5675 family protein [Dyadobacter chenwenxiniae]